MVHRDIKPGNVMLNPETGVMKIIDVDFSRDVSWRSASAAVGVSGTEAYFSPQLAYALEQGEKVELDQLKACDMWALYCTIMVAASSCVPGVYLAFYNYVAYKFYLAWARSKSLVTGLTGRRDAQSS